VLVTRASDAEAELSFAGLIDLCEDVGDDVLAALPGPQCRALQAALLRTDPDGHAPAPEAIALGLLNALRALVADGPLLVAIDDLQWLDPQSADALAFAARRLEDAPVGFLLAARPGAPSALERALERRTLERLAVRPLRLGATRSLLADRLGLSVSRPLLRRIVTATLGNPLFTLELGRTLREHGEPGHDEGLVVPAAVEDMLGTRVDSLPPSQRRLLLAVALRSELRVSELAAIEGRDAIDDAIDAGVLRSDGTRIRAGHPLLAAAARQRARVGERRDVHRALAGAVADRELRALHLALAADVADAQLAATVASAAARASARGARQEAVALSEHALRLTPGGAPERADRVLVLGERLEIAGRPDRVTALLTEELPSLPPGAPRARAWLLLSEGEGIGGLDDLEDHYRRALAEADDDPLLRARVLARWSSYLSAAAVARFGEAETWAIEALAATEDRSPEDERLALEALAWVRCLAGRPVDDLCARFRAVTDVADHAADSPERVRSQWLVWRGELDEARAVITEALATADERGETVAYALQRLHLCELELRAGGWDAAERLLDEWEESAEAELLFPPMYERCRALVAAGRGDRAEAERWAAAALARAEETGVRWDELEARRALGIAALAERDLARAAEHLQPAWAHITRQGVDDPGTFPVAPELVEALADLGEVDAARAVTERLRRLADAQAHPWGRITATRCEALVRIAAGDNDAAAAEALAAAADAYRAQGLRFDAARSLLLLGGALRRRRQWGAAGRALEQAVAAFEADGATGWAACARSDLERVAGRRRPEGVLTPAQQRAAELAASGLSNKEIAQTLVVTVRTVEVHLSQVYAKLGVRSRAQLAGKLSPPEG
jgi:DNA-binding NarL/FixJ family response regulator